MRSVDICLIQNSRTSLSGSTLRMNFSISDQQVYSYYFLSGY